VTLDANAGYGNCCTKALNLADAGENHRTRRSARDRCRPRAPEAILLKAAGNREGYFGNFYTRRALRIFPLYYLLVTGSLAIMLAALQVAGDRQAYSILTGAGSGLCIICLTPDNPGDARSRFASRFL
jgi:hypothetical protein